MPSQKKGQRHCQRTAKVNIRAHLVADLKMKVAGFRMKSEINSVPVVTDNILRTRVVRGAAFHHRGQTVQQT